jgi:hypothetical protein
MRNRPASALACAIAASVLGAPAQAGSVKKSCNLIVDKQSDDRYDVASHDIVGGDVATGKTKVVATVRVRSLADDPRATVLGTTYRFQFGINGTRYYFELRRSAGQSDNASLVQGFAEIGKPDVKVDVPGNQIVFSATRSMFSGLAKRTGAKLTDLGATTSTGTAVMMSTDTALPEKPGTTYTDRTPSCLPAA